MNRVLYFIIISLLLSSKTKAQNELPKVVSGKIERIENFQSKYISERNVDIFLPDGYSVKKKYAVLYMHDGQMLFDPDQTWNKQAWNVDDIARELIQENKVKDFIVVGIWNGGKTRHSDYFPQKPFEQLSTEEKDTIGAQLQKFGRTNDDFQPGSENYLNFIIKELKPYIDRNYAVKTGKRNTLIAGSSMGGLISLYAICEYPKIFGGAACLSTHWVGTFTLKNNPLPHSFLLYLEKNLPNPKNHKIYFDCGDQTLDAMYPEIQHKVDDLMLRKGFIKKNWITKYFPGEEHSEKAWSKRFHIPLEFLLKN